MDHVLTGRAETSSLLHSAQFLQPLISNKESQDDNDTCIPLQIPLCFFQFMYLLEDNYIL